MKRITIARFAGIAAGAGLALGVFAPVGAQTMAQLQAQIATLMAQLQALQGGSAGAAITSDLTVGSSGSQVVALQNALVAQGYLTMPAGVAPGYFGALTKAAVMKWQAASGLPATGYFGAMSRAKFSAGGTTGTTTGGTTVGGTTGSQAGITTPGAEGTITVTTAPVANTTVYEGQDQKEVVAFKVKATGSDVAVQRVKLDLGTDRDVYRKVFSKIYLVDDAGKTLASSDLNSSTVIENGSATPEYEITLAGFSSVVAKGATRNYSVKVDVMDSVESGDLAVNYTLSVSEQGVRAIDGAGIDIYSENSELATRAVNVDASLGESASLAVSTNSANPLSQELVATGGTSENEADKIAILVFDIRAERDTVEITDMINFLVTSAGGATASTTYLYAGNGTSGQLIASDTGSGTDDVADFEDISVMIPVGTSKTFTLAVDVRGANSTQTTFDASWTPSTTNLVAENTEGDAVTTISGSAAANDLLVRNIGPVFSLVGAPTLVRDAGTIGIANGTSTARATFNLKIKAVGSDILFGNNGSTTYPLASNSSANPRSFDIYLGGALSNPVVASSTDYAQPSSGVVSEASNSFTVQEGNEVTIPVSFVFEGRTTAGVLVTTGSYAVGLERLNWVQAGTQRSSTFMNERTEWRTNSVTMP